MIEIVSGINVSEPKLPVKSVFGLPFKPMPAKILKIIKKFKILIPVLPSSLYFIISKILKKILSFKNKFEKISTDCS